VLQQRRFVRGVAALLNLLKRWLVCLLFSRYFLFVSSFSMTGKGLRLGEGGDFTTNVSV
jgi:hypothetical protein